jgi:hypothetical protein
MCEQILNELNYQKEVDFLITPDQNPWMLLEVKAAVLNPHASRGSKAKRGTIRFLSDNGQ